MLYLLGESEGTEMTAIKDLTNQGLNCPSCGSQELRAGYHDWQNMDSFICEKCGLHWNEDTNDTKVIERRLASLTIKDWNTRFIWVLHVANVISKPLMNADSADEGNSLKQFIEKGLK